MNYLYVSKHQAGQLRKHKKLTLDDPLEPGSFHAVRTSSKRPTLLGVKVREVQPIENGYVHLFAITWMPEEPRLLHRRSERGYTSQPALAMPHSEEAVPKDWQEAFSKEANDRDSIRRAGNLQERLKAEREQLDARLQSLNSLATTNGVDVRSDVRVIERRLDAIDAKLKKAHGK